MDLAASVSRAVRRSVERLRGFRRRWTGGPGVQGLPPGEPGPPAGGEPAAKRRRRASGAGSRPGRLPEEPVLEVCVDTVGGVRELSERNAECAARNPAARGPVTGDAEGEIFLPRRLRYWRLASIGKAWSYKWTWSGHCGG